MRRRSGMATLLAIYVASLVERAYFLNDEICSTKSTFYFFIGNSSPDGDQCKDDEIRPPLYELQIKLLKLCISLSNSLMPEKGQTMYSYKWHNRLITALVRNDS